MTEQSKVGFPAVAYTQASDPKTKRAYAVAAALELIGVRILNNTTGSILSSELGKLSEYADLIQAAVDKN